MVIFPTEPLVAAGMLFLDTKNLFSVTRNENWKGWGTNESVYFQSATVDSTFLCFKRKRSQLNRRFCLLISFLGYCKGW